MSNNDFWSLVEKEKKKKAGYNSGLNIGLTPSGAFGDLVNQQARNPSYTYTTEDDDDFAPIKTTVGGVSEDEQIMFESAIKAIGSFDNESDLLKGMTPSQRKYHMESGGAIDTSVSWADKTAAVSRLILEGGDTDYATTNRLLKQIKAQQERLKIEDVNSDKEVVELQNYYNQLIIAKNQDILSKTKMDGTGHSILKEMQIIANMDNGKLKDKKKEAVLKKMEEIGIPKEDYALFTDDKNFSWDIFGKWAGSAFKAGINSFNEGMASTADAVIGNILKGVGWENNPISAAHKYYEGMYAADKANMNLYKEQLGGGAGWQFASDALEGTAGALPNALLAIATAGQSTIASTSNLIKTATMEAGSWLAKAGLTVETMLKNPQFWTSFVRSFGNDIEEAKDQGASDTVAVLGAMTTSLVNAGIEIGIDGASGFQGLPDDLLSGNKSKVLAWVESSLEEGGEEMMQKFVSELVTKVAYNHDADILNPSEYLREGAIGTVSGVALGGGQIALQTGVNATANAYNQYQANKLTDDEQTVVDRVTEIIIAEKEKDGNKLTSKEKKDAAKLARIYVDKGYVKADTIESIFGGESYDAFRSEAEKFFGSDTYKAYKAAENGEKSLAELQKKYDALYQMPNGEKSDAQVDEQAELKRQIEAIQNAPKSADLKAQLEPEAVRIRELQARLRDEVYGRVKGTRLAESYRELARSREKFTADPSKYDNEYARQTVQKILDSKLGDNTNQFHDTVEFLARLSADQGQVIDITDTDGVKAAGHYMEGYVTNGYVTDDGNIVLNYDSPNSLETIVGHEITHVLEKAMTKESNAKFQQALFEYAKTKEGLERFNARLEAAREAYAGKKNTTAEAEVAADLVGEYLFTDYEFISNLSKTDRNAFQRAWDKVKYLAKIAVAGSKEARQLEKAKNMFQKAYNENVKGQKNTTEDGGVKHSLVVRHTNGKQTIVDPEKITREEILDYMEMSFKRTIKDHTYFPVMAHTPDVFLATLQNAGIEIKDKPLAMQATKARQSQLDEDVTTKDGFLIRRHSMTPDEIMRVIEKLNDAHTIIQETGLTKTKVVDGEKVTIDLPDRYVAFVEIGNGKEYVAVIEPDSYIDPDDIVKDGRGEEFHTTVTVFQPDVERDGELFDYSVYLVEQGYDELEIVEKSPSSETAYGEMLATDSKEGLSRDTIAQKKQNVNTKYSLTKDSDGKELTKAQQEFFKNSKTVDAEGNLKIMYHGSPETFTVFDKKKAKSSGYYGKGFYFTDSESHAGQYGNKYEVYLNITNPLQDGTNYITKEQLRNFIEAIADNEDYGIDNYGYGATIDSVTDAVYGKSDFAMLMDINASCVGNMVEAIELFNEVNGTDYNGIIAPTETVAFYPNQIKQVDNNAPTSDPDIRFSLSKDNWSQIQDMQTEVNRLTESIKELEASEDYKEQMRKITEAVDSGNVDAGIKEYQRWLKESGYEALTTKRNALRDELDALRKKTEELRVSEAVEAERRAIEQSGLSEADYFRKQAVKEFGYTPYFYDAGYIVANGKMLNFSGEKGQHFGSRGQDHRAIGAIYAETDGTDALNRFVNEGNIRISPESPGIDISATIEPTKEQYATIKKFIYAYEGKGYFCVDISDTSGRVVGSLEYENRINPARVIGDIQHYYATGEIRQPSSLSSFRYSLSKMNEQQNAYKYNLDRGDLLGAEIAVEEFANLAMPNSKIRGKDGRLIPVYHGTKEMFYEFDPSVGGGKNGTAEGFGIYLSDDQEVTEVYGDRQIKMFANITNPATSFAKTISPGTLVKLIKDTCEKEAQRMVDDGEYDSVEDAIRDTWVSNYVYTYDISMEQAYREVAQSFLRQNSSDMDIVQEVMFGMAIRSYDKAMEFYRDSLIPITGIDGFITKWENSRTGKTSNIYLAFDSNQLKSADAVTKDDSGNVIPLTERFNFGKNDIRYSLSPEGAEPNTYANYYPSGRNFGIHDPLAEFIPVREDVEPAPETVTQSVAEEDMFPYNLPSVDNELNNLLQQKETLEDRMQEAISAEDYEAFTQASSEYNSLMARLEELEQEASQMDEDRLSSLDDADAPPVREDEWLDIADVVPLTKKAATDIARDVRQRLALSNKQMYDVHKLIEEYSRSEFPDREQLFRDIKEKFGTYTESEYDETVKEAKSYLRTFGLFVSDSIKKEIADYAHLMRKNRGRIRFSKDGTEVDVLYHELNSLFPHLFPDSIIAPTDQFMQIVDVANMDAETQVEQQLPDDAIWDVVDAIADSVTRYQQTQKEKAANKSNRESFNSLMRDADEYVLPVDDDIAPVATTQPTEPKISPTVENDIPTKNVTPSEASEPTTANERLAKKLENYQNELAKNQQLREQSAMDYDDEIARLQAEYDAKQNKRSLSAHDLLRRIERLKRMKNNVDADYAKRISDLEKRIEKLNTKEAKTAAQRQTKMEQHTEKWQSILGDTSTWKDMPWGLSYKTKTLRRILRKVVRGADGKPDIALADRIYEELEVKYDHNEALLKRESQKLKAVFEKLNLNHAEDTYAHMLGELRHNPETTLTPDVVNAYYNKHKRKINTPKVERAIAEARSTFDNLLVRVNEALKEQGFKEIPYRKGYFPHFTNPKQGWLAKLLNWKTIDTEIPTSIAGLTETFTPQRSWQSFNKERKGDTTDYSLYQGLDTYIHGALDWIYHIDDLQSRRALENYIRYVHSEEGVKARIDEIKANEEYDADEAQALIDGVLKEANNPLSGLVRELMNRTNTLAHKKAAGDRKMEDDFNRKVYSTMTNLNNRINANMVVGSFSSALTNFIPMVQSWHQVSPYFTVRGLGDMIRSTVRDDGMIAKSDFLTNRLIEEEKLYQTGWDKVTDKAAWLMNVIDNITSQTVWRSKYLQNIKEGMSESQAIKDADQFAKNLMAGRSRGNAPTIFDEKNPITKLFTAFQLEVANQYGYMFEDVPQDTKNKARLVKGYATAFMGAYLYNALYSSLVGRDAAFDPISILEDLLSDMGFGDDDEEEPEDIALNLVDNILEETPFIGGLVGGGRVPISSALPYEGDYKSFISDAFNGEIKAKEMLKPLYYLAMPVGGGQLKKTVEGLSMFDDDLPVSGSYTGSGALRFPVEDTIGNRIKAGLFGQYASKNARQYFDDDIAPLGEKQIQEYIESEMPIADYWEYREGLKDLTKQAEKIEYINSLDVTDEQKNVLKSYVFEEEGYARENPEKYAFLEKEGIGYLGWKQLDDETQESWSWAFKNQEEYRHYKENGIMPEDYRVYRVPMLDFEDDADAAYEWSFDNPEKATIGKVFSGGVKSYRKYSNDLYNIKADKDASGKSISGSRKDKVIEYINNLDAEYGEKLILFKREYNADDTYNKEIVEYLNGRSDLTYEERVTILKELGFTVKNGTAYWD